MDKSFFNSTKNSPGVEENDHHQPPLSSSYMSSSYYSQATTSTATNNSTTSPTTTLNTSSQIRPFYAPIILINAASEVKHLVRDIDPLLTVSDHVVFRVRRVEQQVNDLESLNDRLEKDRGNLKISIVNVDSELRSMLTYLMDTSFFVGSDPSLLLEMIVAHVHVISDKHGDPIKFISTNPLSLGVHGQQDLTLDSRPSFKPVQFVIFLRGGEEETTSNPVIEELWLNIERLIGKDASCQIHQSTPSLITATIHETLLKFAMRIVLHRLKNYVDTSSSQLADMTNRPLVEVRTFAAKSVELAERFASWVTFGKKKTLEESKERRDDSSNVVESSTAESMPAIDNKFYRLMMLGSLLFFLGDNLKASQAFWAVHKLCYPLRVLADSMLAILEHDNTRIQQVVSSLPELSWFKWHVVAFLSGFRDWMPLIPQIPILNGLVSMYSLHNNKRKRKSKLFAYLAAKAFVEKRFSIDSVSMIPLNSIATMCLVGQLSDEQLQDERALLCGWTVSFYYRPLFDLTRSSSNTTKKIRLCLNGQLRVVSSGIYAVNYDRDQLWYPWQCFTHSITLPLTTKLLLYTELQQITIPEDGTLHIKSLLHPKDFDSFGFSIEQASLRKTLLTKIFKQSTVQEFLQDHSMTFDFVVEWEDRNDVKQSAPPMIHGFITQDIPNRKNVIWSIQDQSDLGEQHQPTIPWLRERLPVAICAGQTLVVSSNFKHKLNMTSLHSERTKIEPLETDNSHDIIQKWRVTFKDPGVAGIVLNCGGSTGVQTVGIVTTVVHGGNDVEEKNKK